MENDDISTMVAMLKESHTVMEKLVATVQFNQQMYNEHLASLEHSRDKAQEQVSEMIKANLELTATLNSERDAFRNILQGYRDELHNAKEMYHRTSEAYIRISEMNTSKHTPSNKTEVTIG